MHSLHALFQGTKNGKIKGDGCLTFADDPKCLGRKSAAAAVGRRERDAAAAKRAAGQADQRRGEEYFLFVRRKESRRMAAACVVWGRKTENQPLRLVRLAESSRGGWLAGAAGRDERRGSRKYDDRSRIDANYATTIIFFNC